MLTNHQLFLNKKNFNIMDNNFIEDCGFRITPVLNSEHIRSKIRPEDCKHDRFIFNWKIWYCSPNFLIPSLKLHSSKNYVPKQNGKLFFFFISFQILITSPTSTQLITFVLYALYTIKTFIYSFWNS